MTENESENVNSLLPFSDLPSELKTTDLSCDENVIAKLAVYALLQLSKSGVIYLGSSQKLVRDISKYRNITLKQLDEINKIASTQVLRMGGLKNFSITLKRLTN